MWNGLEKYFSNVILRAESSKNPVKYNDLSDYDSLDLSDEIQGLDSSLTSFVQNDKLRHPETFIERTELKEFSSSTLKNDVKSNDFTESQFCVPPHADIFRRGLGGGLYIFCHLPLPLRKNLKFERCKQNRKGRGDRVAFTLAETLITLVIVGVVAALTVPNMIQKYQEQETVAKVKKSYSILSSAIKLAENANGPIDAWSGWESSTGENSLKILNTLSPYLNIMKNCGTGTGCWYDGTYRYLNGQNWTIYDNDETRARAYLADGISIQVFVLGSPNCTGNYGESKLLSSVCGSINIDINGPKKPNQAGKDYYSFYISKYGLIPWGTNGITGYPLSSYCNNKQSQGFACAAWILSKGNMDYLHKDISW